MSNIQQSLIEQGYAPVPIGVERQDLQNVMDSYMGFLELPEEFHQATVFDLTDRGDGDFGQYTRVAGEMGERGIRPDNKDIFHFGSMSRQVIEARLAGELPHKLIDFLDICESLYWAAQRAKRGAIAELDCAGSGLMQVLSPERSTINDVLRLIAYYDNEGPLAKGHFDRSTTTLAIGESHPGLRIAPAQNGMVIDADAEYMSDVESRLEDVEYQPGVAKFFLGAGWNRLPSELREGNPDLPLGYHDVINIGRRVGERVMRWAIVMFNNPHIDFTDYVVPTPPETRPYKQLGKLEP